MSVRRRVRAREPRELDPVWEWIDDAEFSTAEVRWDREARTVTIPLVNYAYDADFPRPRRGGRGLLAETVFHPWFRARLTVHGARAMRPEPHDLPEPGTIDDVEWLPERRVVSFGSPTGSDFEVEVAAFDVELEVDDEIDHWRRHSYGRLVKWETGGERIEGDPPG